MEKHIIELLDQIRVELKRIADTLEKESMATWNGEKEDAFKRARSEVKNTTAEISDVKCYGTSKNPMTKSEWEEYKKTSKYGLNTD